MLVCRDRDRRRGRLVQSSCVTGKGYWRPSRVAIVVVRLVPMEEIYYASLSVPDCMVEKKRNEKTASFDGGRRLH